MGEKLRPWGAYLVFFYILCLLPLYLENGYFNILEAKYHCMMVLCGLLVLMLPLYLGKGIAGKSLRGTDLWVLCFAGTALLSALFSGHAPDALLGRTGWHVGALTILGLTGCYFLLSRHLPYDQNLWLPVLAVNGIIFLMGILYGAGLDLFYLHQGIRPGYEHIYYATLGNSNWINGYLCLLLPMLTVFFLGSRGRATAGIYLAALVPGIGFLVLCGSDGVYPGLALGAFFLIPYGLAQPARLRRLGLLAAVWGLWLGLTALCPWFGEKRAGMDGLGRILLSPGIWAPVTAGGLAVFLLLRRREAFTGKLHRGAALGLLALLALCGAGAVIWSLRSFSDGWGSGRGLIWRRSLEEFLALPLWRKLLGVGPEQLRYYYEGLVTDRPVMVAHSEPIQILLTTGILGLGFWLLGWGAVLAGGLKGRIWRRDRLAFFLPLIAYFGQSVFNSAMTTNAAMLCLFAALWRMKLEDLDSQYETS